MTREDATTVVPLLNAACDLSADLGEQERYQRLLRHIREVIPYDSAAFLRLDADGTLIPVAVNGLVPETVGRRFRPDEHPRLRQILEAPGPIKFPKDHSAPDPFDGLLLCDASAEGHVHACMGCPLRVQGETLGVLTADALAPDAFDGIDAETLGNFAALLALAFKTANLLSALQSESHRERIVAQQLGSEAHERVGSEFLGASAAAQRIREDIALIARSDLPLLITGETGVGKEVAARAIHLRSGRRQKPLIYLNCAALPESIAESELFGHTRGAFTDAREARAGKFEVADGGTLLLDEIGELPLSLQPKLLRVLQTGELQRVGSDATVRVDVRVIAATNRDLPAEVEAGRFRADLYHRLNVYPLHIPPLRERPADIDLLCGYFLDNARVRLGLGPVRVTAEARAALHAYDWPGNVRELEHALLRASLRAAAGRRGEPVVIGREHLGIVGPAAPAAGAETPVPDAPASDSLREATDHFQRRRIEQALRTANGSWTIAARALGLDRANLRRLAARLGVRHVSS
ncbi:MAG TPA: nitric oxide reductase transcriptional regulator NorR [Candidatus Dormibacteraeota bacterium]|nr:nitric oxide reductase transcriptional regulator NorR [Candidatus Dormibacteraeota bacterium]